jgi:hypothetical protein
MIFHIFNFFLKGRSNDVDMLSRENSIITKQPIYLTSIHFGIHLSMVHGSIEVLAFPEDLQNDFNLNTKLQASL